MKRSATSITTAVAIGVTGAALLAAEPQASEERSSALVHVVGSSIHTGAPHSEDTVGWIDKYIRIQAIREQSGQIEYAAKTHTEALSPHYSILDGRKIQIHTGTFDEFRSHDGLKVLLIPGTPVGSSAMWLPPRAFEVYQVRYVNGVVAAPPEFLGRGLRQGQQLQFVVNSTWRYVLLDGKNNRPLLGGELGHTMGNWNDWDMYEEWRAGGIHDMSAAAKVVVAGDELSRSVLWRFVRSAQMRLENSQAILRMSFRNPYDVPIAGKLTFIFGGSIVHQEVRIPKESLQHEESFVILDRLNRQQRLRVKQNAKNSLRFIPERVSHRDSQNEFALSQYAPGFVHVGFDSPVIPSE